MGQCNIRGARIQGTKDFSSVYPESPSSQSETVNSKIRTKRLIKLDRQNTSFERIVVDQKLPKSFFRGVSLEFLKEILGKGESYGQANGYDLRDLLTVPETWARRCSLAELYEEKLGHLSKLPLIGATKFFVSHAWAYPLSELVQAIEKFEGEIPERAGAYYFIDYFSVNQWKANEDLKSLDMLIENSEGLVLVISNVEKPKPLGRCWCLYELLKSIENEIPVYVTIPDEQRKWLRVLLRTSSSKHELSQFKVDSQYSKASRRCDEDMIKTYLKQPYGFAHTDSVVYKAIVRCLRSLCLSESKNIESQPVRQCVAHQTQSTSQHTFFELKGHELLEKRGIDFPNTYPILSEKIFLSSFPSSSSSSSLVEMEIQDFSYFCYLGNVSPESLNHLFSTCFAFITKGEFFYMSIMILEYVGEYREPSPTLPRLELNRHDAYRPAHWGERFW